jgi:uncharacterized protein
VLPVAGVRALVTGASSGIGAATSSLLASRGAHVLRTGRDISGPDTLVADLATDGVSRILSWAGDVDLLVCNAGVGWAGPLVSMPPDRLSELVHVNVLAQLRLVHGFLPGMLARQRGHVVLVSSIAGCLGVRDEAVYAATKAALRVFAESLRYEVPQIGVTVVFPGVVETAFFDRRGAAYTRSSPKPIPALDVARAIVTAVERGHDEVFTPRWLRFPARLHGALPALVRRVQRRFG